MALKQSKQHGRFISEIMKENTFNVDRRVVDVVATHPYLFTSEVIRNPSDYRPVRHRYLFTIAIRNGREKIVNDNNDDKSNVVKVYGETI